VITERVDLPSPSPDSAPTSLYQPIVSDITTASFTVSWVSNVPTNASVEYCEFSSGTCDATHFPQLPSIVNDAQPFLQSCVGFVSVYSLNAGTTFYYRAKANSSAGDAGYYPSTPPYPSVATKTDTNPGISSNPTFNVAPYYDKNGNLAWDGEPTDAKQRYFMVYLNHTGAETLADRGNGDSGWIATMPASNLRNAGASGQPHALSISDVVSFFVIGVYDNGSGPAVWTNRTLSYTLPDPVVPVVDIVDRTEYNVPETCTGTVAAASAMTVVILSIRLKQRGP